MKVYIEPSGAISGMAKLDFPDEVVTSWIGGSSSTAEFISLMKEIEEGYPGNSPTKLIYEFYEFNDCDDAEPRLISDSLLIPEDLRVLAGISIE